MFQQKGWQGKERKETKPEQSQGSRHFAVFYTRSSLRRGSMCKDSPVHPWYPRSKPWGWDADGLLCCDGCWWGANPNYFGVSLSPLSPPFPSFWWWSTCMPGAHSCKGPCWWISVAAKGLHEALRAPCRFGTSKCGGEEHGGWQENTPTKRGRELPVCLWCICAFLWGDLTLEFCIIHGCLFTLTARKTSCNRRCKKISRVTVIGRKNHQK